MKSKRTPVLTFISNNTKIKGELTFEGNVRLDNYLEGNISSNSGLLIIGEQAVIIGDIRAETVVIIGTVNGSVEALDCVEVSANGKVTGNICAPHVNFEPGSVFVGRCTIGARPQEVESLPEIDAIQIEDLAGKTLNAAEQEQTTEDDSGAKPSVNETT